METTDSRGSMLKRVSALLDELKLVSEISADTPSERGEFRAYQINYIAFLLGELDRAIADYYHEFLGDNTGFSR